MIGVEARAQMLAQAGRLPDVCVACVGGGSNAIGLFHAFREDAGVRLIGVEAGGEGIASGRHAARFADPTLGRPGVLHGTYTYVLQDADGQIAETHSISAGLDYAAVGPEHAYCAKPAAPNTRSPPTTRRWRRSNCSRAPRASCPRWNRRTPSPKPSAWRRPCAPIRSCWSTCRDGGIRTWTRS